jgi:hypothetical protein
MDEQLLLYEWEELNPLIFRLTAIIVNSQMQALTFGGIEKIVYRRFEPQIQTTDAIV